jgi:3-oxoacyl-[acyl-carrier-protein] synthase-1
MMKKLCYIVAVDLVNALGAGPDEVWLQMMSGTCGIRPMNRFDKQKYATGVCAEIPATVESAVRQREVYQGKSRAYLFASAVAKQAIRNIDNGPSRIKEKKTGLVLATTKADINELEDIASGAVTNLSGYWNPWAMAQGLADQLSLKGPVMAVSNACASGLVAIIYAASLLQRGDADIMIVVGVDVLADFILSGFSSLKSLSRRPCRPYDKERDGLSLGEGAGAVILAVDKSNLPVLATIKGWAVTNDANHITGPSRTGEGLKVAMKKALNMAQMTPEQIDYINGHGTGTIYNDEMEAQAIGTVFEKSLPPVTSMKGYFGHTLGAAGTIETGLCLMAMRENTIPACLGFERLGVDKPINVPAEHLKHNLTNVLTIKCGFGGVNAAVILGSPRML